MKEDKLQKDKIETLEKKIKELEDCWKRALADYKNLEKRVEEDKDGWKFFANERLILRILPVIDNLERLKKHMDDKGLDLIIKDMVSSLKEFGVEEINSEKVEFDPMLMEALEIAEGEKNKVVETVSKGYLLNNKLIRPAVVKVGNGQKEA
ncbi:nucleotide exchange factor GrpE [candidate division WWE3 bacterium RIFOXYC2_FULL_42_13]|uniref:Protein GrpE n=2 Tax=Katanobacteria TaxID=422282 RepID=A0A0G1EPX9_UNCKA|nr:MAG: Protein GrpE [candidate division WWE3 bacterium GW2011_GWB2_43_22]OGC58428.1 MAG: nucleotide exchange factor GrpE [candidate division WWE3 bacterium RIFOXYA2_FULL_43_12]OGC64899.1 MAG: nucleotide exchange factor GrpE [candidate division WWE3 bacterium RIFOXYA12_FULL_43_11]OGC73306.1 MAG: nucleotide exchange factor GrpE [candidate division WWE3 bacterium RIFOXYB2_FULL_43_9]OGC73525.1 MAG: nucleotide exchange factor GrpE [candidate division WWE3 bacterium RIFOXYC2_FULL_42_13]HBY09879.1 n